MKRKKETERKMETGRGALQKICGFLDTLEVFVEYVVLGRAEDNTYLRFQ